MPVHWVFHFNLQARLDLTENFIIMKLCVQVNYIISYTILLFAGVGLWFEKRNAEFSMWNISRMMMFLKSFNKIFIVLLRLLIYV